MKKLLQRSFVVFLGIYAVFIGFHLAEIVWVPLTTLFFVCGFSLALLAHARKNYFTIAILAVHMAIEWFEWSQKEMTAREILFNCIHATMDCIFLSHELKVHLRRYRTIALISLTGLLAVIFLFGRLHPIETGSLKNLEPFVIGGVLGCVLSHIYFHIKKER